MKPYLPHYVCLLRDPLLIWLHVIADRTIAVSYLTISACIALATRETAKRAEEVFADIQKHSVLLAVLFISFISACGCSHWLDAYVVYEPAYWVQAIWKVITAAISVAAAAVCVVLSARAYRN